MYVACRKQYGNSDRYKFYWVSSDSGVGEVDVIVAEKWTENMADVRRINERILVLNLLV